MASDDGGVFRLRKAAVGLSGLSALNAGGENRIKKNPVKSSPHGTIQNIYQRNCGRRRPGEKGKWGWVAVATVYLHGLPVSMLVSAKLSGYLLSLLLASVLFFAGSESLSERQVLLLLRADMQKRTCVSSHSTPRRHLLEARTPFLCV